MGYGRSKVTHKIFSMHVVPSFPHYMSFWATWVHFCAHPCALSRVYLMSTLDVMHVTKYTVLCAERTWRQSYIYGCYVRIHYMCVCILSEFIYMYTCKPHTLIPSHPHNLTLTPSSYILILTSPHTLTPSPSQWRYQLHHNRDWSQLGTTATPPALHGGCSKGGEKEETNCRPKYELHPVRG